MKRFFREIRRRAARGIRLTRREQVTLDGVMQRIRKAIKKGRGIRLTKEELQVLGVYGLKRDAERDPYASLPDDDDDDD